MSATSTMEGANPYNAPDAELDRGSNEVYEPSIFSFNGRIGRLRYIAYGVGTMFLLGLVMVPLLSASAFMGGEGGMSIVAMLAMAVFYVGAIVLAVMFAKRRLNDLNRSGWWFLLSFVPIANLLLTLYLMLFPGTDGGNNWGPAPSANSLGVQILAWSMVALIVIGILAAVALPMAGMSQ